MWADLEDGSTMIAEVFFAVAFSFGVIIGVLLLVELLVIVVNKIKPGALTESQYEQRVKLLGQVGAWLYGPPPVAVVQKSESAKQVLPQEASVAVAKDTTQTSVKANAEVQNTTAEPEAPEEHDEEEEDEEPDEEHVFLDLAEIKNALVRHNKSQTDLGDEVGCSRYYISKILLGKKRLTKDMDLKIRRTLEHWDALSQNQ